MKAIYPTCDAQSRQLEENHPASHESLETATASILDGVAAAIAVLDKKGVIVAVNESWRQFALENGPRPGTPAAHTEVGTQFLKICEHGEGIWCNGGQAACAGIRAVLRGDTSSFSLEYNCHCPAGQRWFSLSAHRLGMDDHAVVLTQTDITEGKREEAALRASEERLSYVLLATREAIWDYDLTTGRVTHNHRWCEMLGFEGAMLEHPVQFFFDLIHPDDQAAVMAESEEAFARSGEYFGEYRLRRADGSYIWVADHGRIAARGPGGHPMRAVGALADITERKMAEAQLDRSKDQLRALAARLQAVREEERTRIAGEVHDELGQTLTGLTLDLAWLGKRVAKVGNEELRQQMTEKLAEIDALTRMMIRQVREIASDMRPQVLDNLGLASAIRFEAERFQQRSGIACEVDLPSDAPALPPEIATGLFRIFQESLTNVVRHAHATRVSVWLGQQDGRLVLLVHDDGRGITPGELADVHSLGLLGMRERAAQFGATLTVEGQPGWGTTIMVTMP